MVTASNSRVKFSILNFNKPAPDMEVNTDTSTSPGHVPASSSEVKDPMRDSLLSSDCEVELDAAQICDNSVLSPGHGGAGSAPLLANVNCDPIHSGKPGGADGVSSLSSGVGCLLPPNVDGGAVFSNCLDSEMKNSVKPEGMLDCSSDKQGLLNTNDVFRLDSRQTDKQSAVCENILTVRDLKNTCDKRTLQCNSEAPVDIIQNRTSENKSSNSDLVNHDSKILLRDEEKLSQLGQRWEDGSGANQAVRTRQALPTVQEPSNFYEKSAETNEQSASNRQSSHETQPDSERESSKFSNDPSDPDASSPKNESRSTSELLSAGQVWEAVGQCDDILRPDVGDESPFASLSPERRGAEQEELEFDDWQGQFEFCTPALQDCPFVLSDLIDSVDLGSEGYRSVYRDLINTVKQLQNRVEVLGDTQTDSQDRIVRVKQENSVLQERVVVLEEQLREAEHRAEDRLAEEQRRNRELIQRVEREKTLTVENYAIKQEHLEKTNQRLEEEVQRLRAKADRHQRERNELENSLSEAQILVANLKEENKLLVSQSKKELQEDQEQSAKVIEELRAEVERLTAVLETTGRKRVPSTDSITASTDQLTAALTSLRQENKSLEEQVEELQAQLLTRGLEEGRELITAAANESLAAEFDAMTQEEVELKERETVEELQKSLHDVQEANKQLRTYIDGILLNIVENHPQLLEVKRKSS